MPVPATTGPALRRRAWLLGGLAAATAALSSRHGGHAMAALPAAAVLLAPGPEDSSQGRWAASFAAALGRRTAPQPTRLEPQPLGGADGVTAANRFATSAAPDGRTLLAMAGAAAHARMIGDGRARYEPSAWLPVCGLVQPTALLVRAPAVAAHLVAVRRAENAAPAPLRLGLPGPEAPEAAALLALELLGVRAQPVFGMDGTVAEPALAEGRVDAILAGGPNLAARARAIGAEPWFAVARPEAGPHAAARRDPALPGVPSLAERIAFRVAAGVASPAAEMVLAADAGLAAARMHAAIVLPALTPADLVALWRHAATRLAEELLEDGAPEAETACPLLPGTEAAAAYAAACAVPEPVVQAYRGWLARRLDWRGS